MISALQYYCTASAGLGPGARSRYIQGPRGTRDVASAWYSVQSALIAAVDWVGEGEGGLVGSSARANFIAFSAHVLGRSRRPPRRQSLLPSHFWRPFMRNLHRGGGGEGRSVWQRRATMALQSKGRLLCSDCLELTVPSDLLTLLCRRFSCLCELLCCQVRN